MELYTQASAFVISNHSHYHGCLSYFAETIFTRFIEAWVSHGDVRKGGGDKASRSHPYENSGPSGAGHWGLIEKVVVCTASCYQLVTSWQLPNCCSTLNSLLEPLAYLIA